MKTRIHTYNFDTCTTEGAAGWNTLVQHLEGGPPIHGPVSADVYAEFKHLDGLEVTLGLRLLFINQWNATSSTTKQGFRIFDWALEFARGEPHVRRGHYLVQTPEMQDIRRNTNACGYCGYQEAAQRGLGFCNQCGGSRYLKRSDLHLLRMRPVSDPESRAPLTESEMAYMAPLFLDAQINGVASRDTSRVALRKAVLLRSRDLALSQAADNYDGMMWLLDHGIDTNNVVYRGSVARFVFGRFKPLTVAEADELSKALSADFLWPYSIERAGLSTVHFMTD